MPFEALPSEPRRIAVIGGGISGLGAAYRLSQRLRVTVFEAEPRLGGHARTKLAGKRGDQPVDTGFIVYNRANYPNMVRLFEELEVPVVKSDMSFGASLRGGAMEYGLRNLSAVFAQKRNALDPRFLGMLRDVLRFNANALRVAQEDRSLPLGAFLDKMKMGEWFRRFYLLPLSGAIWSTPVEKILDFPAHALVQFFENHALLHHTGQHQWYTVEGGSREYVSRLEAALLARDVELRSGCPVEAVRREGGGVLIRAQGAWERFDAVVMATHSDDSLRMLDDPSPQETRALVKVKYQPNRVVLHADASVMPKRKAVWSSWNYTETARKEMNQIDLTYWMNCLQPIPQDDPMFVTLNSTRPIREELIYDEVTLRHPVYDLAALEGQRQVAALNGERNTVFCGAWMRNGFHEDGLATALEAAELLEAKLLQEAKAA